MVEEPKGHRGASQGFACSISIGKLDRRMEFFPVRLVRTCCKRNYFVLQYKITILPIGESFGGMFKCCAMDVVEGELFHFQLLSINCEIVLTC